MDPLREGRIIAAIADAEQTLWSKGYSVAQAAACTKTARKWAQGIAGQVSPEIRDQVYEDLLQRRLVNAERWLERQREGVAGAKR